VLRFSYAKGATFPAMRESYQMSPLFRFGDALLVWVNEGDFWSLTPAPTDVDAEEETRRREDAILAQADEIRARRAAALA
jgi:hypothetical protein